MLFVSYRLSWILKQCLKLAQEVIYGKKQLFLIESNDILKS